MSPCLVTMNLDSAEPCNPEVERQRQYAWEAAMIAEADAEIASGHYVDADQIDAWIDSIGTDPELPPPPAKADPGQDRRQL